MKVGVAGLDRGVGGIVEATGVGGTSVDVPPELLASLQAARFCAAFAFGCAAGGAATGFGCAPFPTDFPFGCVDFGCTCAAFGPAFVVALCTARGMGGLALIGIADLTVML